MCFSQDRLASESRGSEREISGRKRAEAALHASRELSRQIETNTPIGVALLALDGSLIRVNPALCSVTGYTENELMSLGQLELTQPEELASILAYMQQTSAGNAASHEFETRLIHNDGHELWSSVTLSLVRNEGLEGLYFIAQVQDISLRKAAERAARIVQEAALSSADAKSRFLATMSHELRTPMNGIIGTLELLSLSTLDADQTELVKIVRESSGSLLRVLNDILDFSKIEAGKLRLESIAFDLASQVNSALLLFAAPAADKGVALTADLDPQLPSTLRGDPGRFRQVLTNLVGNALKFTPPAGTIRVSVVQEQSEGPSVTVRVSVVDTGVGFAPAAKELLFQPFSQLDESTTRKFGGTGLGLAICKQLVELMGGAIGVSGAVDAGSTFWFTLPFESAADPALAAGTGLVRTGERANASPRSEKLLLAEDNEINALLATKQFGRLGFRISVVVNGHEAVRMLEKERFDLVFMDCHMPVMDGLAATRLIRKLPAHLGGRVPIVAMTANAQAQDREECLAAGMDDYISKPATLADLRGALERWLPEKSAADDAAPSDGKRASVRATDT